MARRNKLQDEWQFEVEASLEKQTLPIKSITLPASQPRRYFDPEKLRQLTESVRQHGILEPILVRPSQKEGVYELVAGERRFRAAQEVGLSEIPATIRELNDEESLQLALVENLQREDLNPVEETEGILQLLALRLKILPIDVPPLLYKMRNEAIGTVNQNVLINSEAQSVQAVFAELGTITWESFATTRLPLLRLPPEILEALQSGKIAYTKAQAIARVKDDTQRRELLTVAITEDLSLTQIKDKINELKSSSSSKELPPLKSRMDEAYRQMKRSKIWSDPKRQKQLEKLVAMVEALVSEDS